MATFCLGMQTCEVAAAARPGQDTRLGACVGDVSTQFRTTEIDLVLSKNWQELRIRPEELACDHRGTLVPRARAGADPVPSGLPLLFADAGAGAHLTMHPEVLGRGAMGVVHSATQLPLGREVAVKTLGDRARDPRAKFQMLREARVTGALEHPNVVPVYMLGGDEAGVPVIVMKSISGTRWSDLFDPGELARHEGTVDALGWHLKVLMQVCNAVHYAHSKRILHRDLKPDNVMIGEFGEVYVLDWGLAVSLERDNRHGLIHVENIGDVAGTPTYMPPELVAVATGLISERSDVYLLGAILHEILTGEPRHQGKTLLETLQAALRSEPVNYDASVPEELGAVANKATAVDPADRFPSAEAFKGALDEFLQHRHVRRLSSEAAGRFERLGKLLDEPSSGEEGSGVEIQKLFVECRFGYEEALRQWPGCAEARSGLSAVLERMTAHEIEHGNVKAAAVLLAQLPHPPAELQEKLAALRARLAEERAELERLEHLGREADRSVGRGVRGGILGLMGLIWTLFYFALGFMWRRAIFHSPHVVFLFVNVAYGAFLVLALRRWRSVLKQTRVNRAFVWTLWAAFGAAAVLWPAAWLFGVPFGQAVATTQLLYATVVWMSGAAVDPALSWAALPYLFGFVGTLAFPEYAFEAIGLSTLGAMTTAASRWRPDIGSESRS
jgi:eukaryotic-like serine/threonine-protein kinase